MGIFEPGTVLKTKSGVKITVESYIAGGGQGDVYKVLCEGKEKALKWYKPGVLDDPDAFYSNLERNVNKGSPDKAFIWPEKITERSQGSFGYVMALIPEGYKEFADILASSGGGGFDSYKEVVGAGIKIVSAFRNIHKIGYSYQDMNSGNFYINPKTGDVLICDNDNVAPNGTYTGIAGTPRFMAPEIVLGQSMPNTYTDEFSLAVVLFMLLCCGHPLEGRHWVEPCLTPEIERALYGDHAVFIFDQENAYNRPVKGIHNNVLHLWGNFPSYIKDVFLKAFSKEAIYNPEKRVKLLEWLKVLTRFQSDIVKCPACDDNEIFIIGTSDTDCDKCGRTYKVEHTLKLNEYSVTAAVKTRVYRCQLGACNADAALDDVIEVLVTQNGTQDVLCLKNLTKDTILAIGSSGTKNHIQPGGLIPLRTGINIKAYDGEIEIK